MVEITRERFEELVGEALDELPAWVVDAMDNVTVQVEDLPPRGQATLLGLYHGMPHARLWRRLLSDSERLKRNDAGLLLEALEIVETPGYVESPVSA